MPECQKIKKGRLDHYGPEHFEVLPFDGTWLERVHSLNLQQNPDRIVNGCYTLLCEMQCV